MRESCEVGILLLEFGDVGILFVSNLESFRQVLNLMTFLCWAGVALMVVWGRFGNCLRRLLSSKLVSDEEGLAAGIAS